MALAQNAPVSVAAPFSATGLSESLDLVSQAPVGVSAGSPTASVRISPSVFVGAGVAGVGVSTQSVYVSPRQVNPIVWGTSLKVPALITVT